MLNYADVQELFEILKPTSAKLLLAAIGNIAHINILGGIKYFQQNVFSLYIIKSNQTLQLAETSNVTPINFQRDKFGDRCVYRDQV